MHKHQGAIILKNNAKKSKKKKLSGAGSSFMGGAEIFSSEAEPREKILLSVKENLPLGHNTQERGISK